MNPLQCVYVYIYIHIYGSIKYGIFIIHIVEYNSVIKRNEVLIYVATWMNLENKLSGRSQTIKSTYCMILII